MNKNIYFIYNTRFYKFGVYFYMANKNLIENSGCNIEKTVTNGPPREKTVTGLWRFANNTDANQPAHPRSLISAFVIRLLKSIISRLATGEISIF